HAREQAVCPAIEIVRGDDVRAVIEEFEHGRGGRHAGGEGEAAGAALEIGDAALVGHARRILRARILVALVHARTRLDIGRCRIDRRHDSAGCRVGLLASVDAARREAAAVLGWRHVFLQRTRRRKGLMKSMRVISPRNLPSFSTPATWSRAKIGIRSSARALGAMVSTFDTIARRTGSASAVGSLVKARSRSLSSMMPTSCSFSITGSCETS